jgi:tetratricopeptide (TPR) repeat protein
MHNFAFDLTGRIPYTNRTMYTGSTTRLGVRVVCFLGLFLLGVSTLQAQMSQEQLQREIRYATDLMGFGFPDKADKYLDGLPVPPEQVEMLRIQVLGSQKKFDEAIKMIESKPQGSKTTMMMKLALADAYYMWGMYPEAQKIYTDFFEGFGGAPPENLKEFYIDSAYKYAQMLLLMGLEEDAIKAYEFMLNAGPNEFVKRQCMIEAAELIVKVNERKKKAGEQLDQGMMDKALKWAEDIQWGAQDMWFGKSLSVMAHIFHIRGEAEKAIKLIKNPTYLAMLKQLDVALKETDPALARYSPMAECRYMVGVIMMERGDKLREELKDDEALKSYAEAIQHLFNVFIKYPASPWAPDAGRYADRVKKILIDDMGKTIEMPEVDMRPVVEAQFKQARTQFLNNQWADAVESYTSVLKVFPEEENAPQALGNMITCFLKLEDVEKADVTLSYLAERFGHNPDLAGPAGDALTKIAESYKMAGEAEKGNAVYKMFFDNFPDHPGVPVSLFRFGDEAFNAEDYDEAMRYYKQILDEHKTSHVYRDAFSRYAQCFGRKDEYDKEYAVLKQYVKILPAGSSLISAKFRLADALRKMDDKYIPLAIQKYEEIDKLLEPDPNPYMANPDEKRKSKDVQGLALFRRAFCTAKLKGNTPETEEAYKKKALELYSRYVKEFPDQSMAPSAMSYMVTLYTAVGDPEQANAVMNELREKHPDHDAVKNALYQTTFNLLELGQVDKAIKTALEMTQNAAQYGAVQLLKVGELLVDHDQYKEAYDALKKANEMAEHDYTKQRSLLALGKAAAGLGQYQESVDYLEKLVSGEKMSSYGVQACYALAESYSQLGAASGSPEKKQEYSAKVNKVMKIVYRYAKTPGDRAHADFAMGKAQLNMGLEGEATGSWMRMLMLQNPASPGVRKWYEEAFADLMPLMRAEAEKTRDLKAWSDIYDTAKRFRKHIKDGDVAKQASKVLSESKTKILQIGGMEALEAAGIDLSGEVEEIDPNKGTDSEDKGTDGEESKPDDSAGDTPAEDGAAAETAATEGAAADEAPVQPVEEAGGDQ